MYRLLLKLCCKAAHHLRRDESGTSLLEMAIVMPFLIVFGLGVLEFGNALYQYHLITSGVRDAGRYAASLGDVDGDESPDRDAAARTNIKKIAVCGSITDCTLDSHKRLNWWPASIDDLEDVVQVRYCIKGVQEGDTGPDCECDGDLSLRGGTNKVCVGTAETYDDVGLLAALGLGDLTITAVHEERYFGGR